MRDKKGILAAHLLTNNFTIIALPYIAYNNYLLTSDNLLKRNRSHNTCCMFMASKDDLTFAMWLLHANLVLHPQLIWHHSYHEDFTPILVE